MLFQKNDRVLFYGDSVTDADRSKPTGQGIAVFNPWGYGYVSKIAAFMGGIYPELNIHFINKGTSGEQTRHLVRRFDTDVRAENPDVISIMIGANDIWRQFDESDNPAEHVLIDEYTENMKKLIDMSLEVTDRVIIMSPFMIESCKEDAMLQKIYAYTEVCERLAKEKGVIFINTMSGIEELLKSHHPYYYSWDRIHPSAMVQAKLVNMFFKATGLDLMK